MSKTARTSSTAWLAAVLLALLPATVESSDWPGWRGPERNGKSPESGLLERWPEGGPPLLFQASGLGSGYSSLAVVGGRAYTLGDFDDGQYAVALEIPSGKLAWKTRIGPRWEDQYGGPRSTPTVDGGQVFVLGTDGDLAALSAASGEVQWRKNLQKDFGGSMMSIRGTDWRFSESPLVDGERVVVTPGGSEAALVALHRKSGEEIWRTRLPDLGEKGADGAAYSSVMISSGAGVRQYVQLLGRGVVGVDTETGKFLWGYNRVANHVANIATPIIDGDHVFVSTGYDTGSALLRLEAKDDGGIEAREVYFLGPSELQNHHGGLILDQGLLYTGTGHNKGFPICVEMASGKAKWGPERNAGKSSAAVTWADGLLYFRYQDGRMILIEATGDGYEERGTFMIPDVNQFSWSHPVIADGKLFLREQDNLYCYDLRPEKTAAQPEEAATAQAAR